MRASSYVAIAASVAAMVATMPLSAAAAPAGSAPEGSAVVVAAKKKVEGQLRFATFNVRTSRADRGTSRHWLKRASSVAREIKTENPDIVAIQELGPGRADGKKGKLKGAVRQTESLLRALNSVGAGQYKLVRTTAYVKPGKSHGTQGARILYNTNRVRLVSNCPQTTGRLNYNGSCSMDMPRMGGSSTTRSAAYAQFEDKKTGKNFFAVSVHLDERHSGSLSKERRLDSLRRSQARAVYNRVSALAGNKPILWGGDINSWRTKRGSHAPYNLLTSVGFKDSVSTGNKIDARYPTVNHWKRVLKANAPGRQVALDVVMVKNGTSFSRYENVMKTVDSSRPSDHNMVVADLNL